MDWAQQQGVSLPPPPPPPRSDHPRMQYQHGGSRSRMPPFARGGGAYSRRQKQFYVPPPAAALPPPLQNKYEVLMEAGRLAAEYLVAKGVLPPASLQRGGAVGPGGWGQLPPPPPVPASQEAPVHYDARNGRRRVDDEYSNPNARSRRDRGGDYSSSNRSNYSGRGKRKFGPDNRYSDWGRDRGKSRGYSDSWSYDEEDEDGAPGFRRERRGSGAIDEVGSSVSGVAGEGPASKVEAMGESELEDTGSKVSSSSNVRQNTDALQELEDENENENEANKMQEDSVVSTSEVVEQTLNDDRNSNNASSGVQEAETKHLPMSLDETVSDGRPEDSSVLNEKVEDDKPLDEKAKDDMTSDEASIMETNFCSDSRNLLNFCSFARIPTRPRSVLAHRNAGPAQRETAVAEQVDPVSSEEVSRMALDGGANANFLTTIQSDSKDDLVGQERADLSTACNQVAESVVFHEKETQGKTEEMEEQNSIPQHYGVRDNKEHIELSPALVSCQNNLRLQVEKGIQIYNIDTPPQDEELIGSSDKGKAVGAELSPTMGAEAVVTTEEENLGQSSSFKIHDRNLVANPEVAEVRNDPRLSQCSTAGCSVELQDKQQVDFGTTVGNNPSDTDTYAPFILGNKAVQVIDIKDDSPIEAGTCDTSKANDMIYSSTENMMNPTVNTDVLHGIQDGYSLAISDYIGADMPCYQSIERDLQAGMGLNGSEGITVMDDLIYSSLSDIGFMEVWDQPPQDYEKFF
ncbi:uncharacterized protein At4g26450-like isoform X2 [Phragmites australis]|uniref:uncharacterized protein At4g26450-like isoform X2 n=1 Tax=Phragmites australis TaxID=29695 RepID=UPI002D7A0FAD|nr:uncharacterized protein At4g26450-like isoform X2 [Phragmites australis]